MLVTLVDMDERRSLFQIRLCVAPVYGTASQAHGLCFHLLRSGQHRVAGSSLTMKRP